MSLCANLSLYSYRKTASDAPQKFLLITLEGSTVNPTVSGALDFDQTDKRGWYTEQVDVEMTWADSPAGELVRSDDQPQTTSIHAESSTSSTIDFSEGLGIFGPDLTLNASAGGSISSSWSEEITDFDVVNRTTDIDGLHIKHVMRLRAVEGGAYESPNDLVDQTGGTIVGDIISGHLPGLLKKLPAKATSNIPLLSQALFRSLAPLSAVRTLLVTVTHYLALVEKTFVGYGIKAAPMTARWQHQWAIPVDFSQVR